MAAIEPITLSAASFTLRPALASDVDAATEMLADAQVRQWNPGPDDLGRESVLDWLVRSTDWSLGSFAVWVIADGTQLVGNCVLWDIDRDQLHARVAYRTAPWARGRGVATAATTAMADYAFEALHLERLTLEHSVANPASCRVAAKSGFGLEGTQRGGFRDAQGRRWDSHVHGRVRDDVEISG